MILGHSYQTPDILFGISDFKGDSLELSRQAQKTDAHTIVFCGVRFMAETAKILCPEKTVLLPDPEAGCSLDESITAEGVRRLRREHPQAAAVCYINTSAAVKAECDIVYVGQRRQGRRQRPPGRGDFPARRIYGQQSPTPDPEKIISWRPLHRP